MGDFVKGFFEIYENGVNRQVNINARTEVVNEQGELGVTWKSFLKTVLKKWTEHKKFTTWE